MVLGVYGKPYSVHDPHCIFELQLKIKMIEYSKCIRMHIGVFNYSFRHNVFISYAEISANWKPQSHVSSAYLRTNEWIHAVQIVVAHNFVYGSMRTKSASLATFLHTCSSVNILFFSFCFSFTLRRTENSLNFIPDCIWAVPFCDQLFIKSKNLNLI